MSTAQNGGFLMKREIPDTVVASSERTGYEVGNLFTKIPLMLFQTNTLTGNLTIDMEWVSQISLAGFAIINHSIPEVAVIKLKYSNNGWESFEATDVLEWSPNNIYILLDRTYRFVRLQVENVTGKIISIGELFPATERLQFPENFNWDLKQSFHVLGKRVEVSDYGTIYETPDEDEPDFVNPPTANEFVISFSDTAFNNYFKYQMTVHVGKKVWIPSFLGKDCYYGLVMDTILKTDQRISGISHSITFREDATGVV